jgi:hypothetical protein
VGVANALLVSQDCQQSAIWQCLGSRRLDRPRDGRKDDCQQYAGRRSGGRSCASRPVSVDDEISLPRGIARHGMSSVVLVRSPATGRSMGSAS